MPTQPGTYTTTQMAKAARLLEQASSALHVGGVVLGETHDSPHSRGLAANLISRTHVRRLFMELPDLPVQSDDHLAMPDGSQPARAGDWLRAWAGQPPGERSAALESASWGEFKKFLNGRYANVVPISRLFEHAVRNGVLVYCIDVDNPGAETDETRDAHMANVVGEAIPNAEDRSRNLVIVGGLHTVQKNLTAAGTGAWQRLDTMAKPPDVVVD